VTGGLGLETRLWRLRIAPTVRYTYWSPARARVTGEIVNNGIYRNQVQGQVGISF
jgi:hypothetical protein